MYELDYCHGNTSLAVVEGFIHSPTSFHLYTFQCRSEARRINLPLQAATGQAVSKNAARLLCRARALGQLYHARGSARGRERGETRKARACKTKRAHEPSTRRAGQISRLARDGRPWLAAAVVKSGEGASPAAPDKNALACTLHPHTHAYTGAKQRLADPQQRRKAALRAGAPRRPSVHATACLDQKGLDRKGTGEAEREGESAARHRWTAGHRHMVDIERE